MTSSSVFQRGGLVAMLVAMFGLASPPEPRSSRAGGAPDERPIPGCETFLTISQMPSSPHDQLTASITVEYGETITTDPICLSSGDPDPATFQFTVNGVDRTSSFTVDMNSATASAVPLVAGTNTLVASIVGHDSVPQPRTDTDTRVLTVAIVGAEVTPDGQALSLPQSNNSAVAAFSVRNSGNASGTITLVPSCSGAITSCPSVSPSSLTLGANQTGTASVTFTPNTLGSGTVKLAARNAGGATLDTGFYAVTVTSPPETCSGDRTRVTCESSEQVSPSTHDVATFTVYNDGPSFEEYEFSCSVEQPVSSCVAPTGRTRVEAGSSLTVQVPYTTGSTPGLGSLTLRAFSYHFGEEVFASVDRSVGGAFARIPLTVAATGGNGQRRSVCPTVGVSPGGAAQCGDLLYAHGFPGYRSLNEVRALTLLYNSATARPIPIVAVDYHMRANRPVGRFHVVVTRVGAGDTLAQAWFDSAAVTYGKRHWRRLALSVDAAAASLGTGAYPIQVTVTRRVDGAWQTPETRNTHLVVVDRRRSAFGSGWWPAGVERLFPNQSDSAALLVYGDGSTIRFAAGAEDTFIAPPGEHATLVRVANGFERRLPGDRIVVSYDTAGLVTSVTDLRHSLAATYSWQSGGPEGTRLRSITDPTGKAIVFDSVSSGFVGGIQVPGVLPISLTHSALLPSGGRQLASVIDPDTLTTSFTYDSIGRQMLTSKGRGTGVFTYAFDVAGRMSSVTPPAGSFVRTLHSWQKVGLAGAGTTMAAPATSAPDDSVRFTVSWRRFDKSFDDRAEFRVSSTGAPSWLQLPATDSMTIERDSAGQPTRIRTAAGMDVTQVWDANGQLTHSIQLVKRQWSDPTLVSTDTTRYEYHPRWRSVTRVVPPAGQGIVEIVYDSVTGDRTIIRNAKNRETRFTYNARGQVREIREPNADSTLASESVPTVFEYDSVGGNITRIVDGEMTAQYVYDSVHRSRVDSTIDAVGVATRYVYDAMGRVRSVSTIGDTLTRTVQQLHDDRYGGGSQARKTLIDPLGAQSDWYFDANGRLVQQCTPAGCETTTYEDGANPTLLSLRGSRTIAQTFDGAGRVLERVASASLEQRQSSFRYDGAGNMILASNARSDVELRFDAYGRKVCEEQRIRHWNDSTNSSGAVAWYQYDAGGQISHVLQGSASCTGSPSGSDTLIYAYDIAGALQSIRHTYWNRGTERWDFRNDGKGRLARLDVPMSPSAPEYRTWTYDAFDRLLSFRVSPGYRDSIISYDSLGRVRQLRTVAGERTHSYDAFGRLTQVVGAGDTGYDRFVYDLAGNRLQDTSWTYQIEAGTNRLRYKTHRNEACSFEHLYDLRGNETSVQRVVGTPSCSTMEERTQTYDPENRLVATRRILNTGTATAIEEREFWYDALGRRILLRSTNDTASDNGTWRYFWFGDHVGVKTWNPNDSGLVDLWWPSLQRGSSRGEWFIYGPGVDNLLGSLVFRGKYGHDVRYVFEQDYRGSVRAVQDDSGRAVPGLDGGGFGPFGTPSGARTEALAGFNGAEHAGGLVYMRNRWYDPNTGRFTQEDPIGSAGGINLYAYAGNDPMMYRDPFGLCPEWLDNKPCVPPIDSPMEAADSPEPSGKEGSEFGLTRSGRTQFHNGFDWKASPGTPVRAPGDATVTAVGDRRGSKEGNYVQINLRNGTRVTVLHLSKFEGMAPGQTVRVRAGDIVGYTGTTGNASRSQREPHGHVITKVSGRPCNPRDFFSADGGGGSCR